MLYRSLIATSLVIPEGELESTIAELDESNRQLETRKAQRDAAQGGSFPILNFGSKLVAGDKTRDKQKDLQDMELALKELSVICQCFLIYLIGMFMDPDTTADKPYMLF